MYHQCRNRTVGAIRFVPWLLVLLALVPLRARAEFLTNDFGLVSPTTTIAFDEHVLPAQAPITTAYSDLGITFSSMF
jgi:hypothetical protein